MRALLVGLLLVSALSVAALAPTAGASAVCVGLADPSCPGAACVGDERRRVCVPHCDPVGCAWLP